MTQTHNSTNFMKWKGHKTSHSMDCWKVLHHRNRQKNGHVYSNPSYIMSLLHFKECNKLLHKTVNHFTCTLIIWKVPSGCIKHSCSRGNNENLTEWMNWVEWKRDYNEDEDVGAIIKNVYLEMNIFLKENKLARTNRG